MSLTSSFLPRISTASSNAHWKYLLGIFGLGNLSLALACSSYSSQEQEHLEKAKHKLNSQEAPKTIFGKDAFQYPWSNNPNKNYEFDIVKMRGYFKEERFFVQKSKDGKKGYAVFAPFVTSHTNLNTHPYRGPQTNVCGIMVNLGWVPVDSRNEVGLDSEPLGTLDMDDYDWGDYLTFKDEWTEFEYKKEYDEEREEVYPFTDVTGIVRRGERYNPIVGNTNMVSASIFQYVDPLYMKMMFGFNNDLDFDDHY